MKLTELAAALTEKPKGQTILIYGDPKSGKTRLAATMAKVPWIHRIFWFDLEKGSDTIITMWKQGILTHGEIEKFEIIRIPDTPLVPRAMETIMKVLTSKKKFFICEDHGKVDCQLCKTGTEFNLAELGHNDLVVIDSGSQLADSTLNFYCAGKSIDFKPGWDEYGPQIRVLSDFMSIIQQGATNYVMITHVLNIEEEENGEKKDREFPLFGTKSFSRKTAKYFDHVIYTNIKSKTHKAGSSTSYKTGVVTGSRLDFQMEKTSKPDFAELFKILQEEAGNLVLRATKEAEVQTQS
jgi:hypothetical protein